jgi:hypothetical protein
LQDISFLNSQESIHRIEDEYIKRGFTVVGTPERFIIPDSLVFDGTVHLSKEGADYRTRRLIGDLTYVIDSLNLANPGRDILE